MTTPLPKRYGYKLPLEASGGVCIRVSIEFPDKLEYRAAFSGAINMLGKWFQWDHTQADYQDIPELNVEVAQVWSGVLAAATWEECMEICAEIAACIHDDEDVQHQIARLILHNQEMMENLSQFMREHPGGTETKIGQPIDPNSRLTITEPGCDLDLLYAQCLGLVQTANRMVEDFIQNWEVYTNQGEVVSDIVQAVPLLAELAQASGITGVLEYANDLVDSIGENYLADYDETYEIGLACELFCAAQPGTEDGCFVTSQMAADILNTRIGNALNLANLEELIVSLTDQDITGFNVADLYLAFFFNALAIGNLVIPVTWGLDTFINVMASFDTGNNDWETECEDCPPPLTACVNFLGGNQGTWVPAGHDDGQAQFTADGIGQENNTYLRVWGEGYTNIHSFTITFNTGAWPGTDDYHKFLVNISNIDGTNFQTTTPPFGPLMQGDSITITTTGDNWNTLAFEVLGGGGTYPPNGSYPQPVYIVEICVDSSP